MSDDFNSSSSINSTDFVDIHGRDIAVIIGEHGDILVPLSEVRKTGFSIYKKSQHNKLVISDKQFNDEFNLYMLEQAKTYMLTNRISFQPEDVLRSIENCKRLLTGGNKTPPKPQNPSAMESRSVIENGNDDLKVQVNQQKTESQRGLSMKNVQEHNNRNLNALSSSSSEKPFNSSENGNSKSSSAPLRNPHNNIFKQKWNNRNEIASENGNSKSPVQPRSPHNDTFKKEPFEASENGSVKSPAAPIRSPHNNTLKNPASEASENGNVKSPPASIRSPHNNTLKKAPFEASENGNFKNSGPTKSPHNNTFKKAPSEGSENGNFKNPGPIKSPHNNTFKPKWNESPNIPEKLPSVQLTDVRTVTVTHHEKENIIWARDKEHDDLLDEIYNGVFEDAKKQPNTRNFQLNTLYLAQDANEWYRCKILRFKPLTVSFVDYGNIVETDHIKTISAALAKHPCLANRMSFRGLAPDVGTDIEVKIVRCYDDGTYSVSILNRFGKNPTPPKIQKPIEVKEEFCIRPKLTHGERVTIIHEENGTFYLRNQKGYIDLNTINELIKNMKLTPISNPRINDMVLCKKRNESNEFTYCRGIIKSFDEDLAEIEFIDYSGTCISSLDTLMQTEKSLNVIEGTFLTLPQLVGWKNKPFTSAQRNYIENKIKSRQKYTVIVVGSDFDLEDVVCCLSIQLLELERGRSGEIILNDSTNNVLMLNEIAVYQPKLGISGYMCTHFKNLDNVSFVSSEALEENIGNVFFTETPDNTPYKPIVGEVCLGQYNESWNRCAVSRVVSDKFEVVFIDFGNIEIRTSNELRKAGPDCKIAPALSIPCQLVDLPRTQQAETILKELIVENEVYNVKIKACKNGKYEIEVPSAYENLRAAL